MTPPTSNPFGAMTASSGKVDFSANSGFKLNGNTNFYNNSNSSKNKNSGSHTNNNATKNKQDEDIKDILNSAVGDFTERPLQIMIREIAKNFLIFTPIGWIILLVILGRKYKGNLSSVMKNINEGISDVANSFNSAKKTQSTETASEG